MLIEYITIYLVFIIMVSLLIGLIVMKLRIPHPHIVIPAIVAIILLPAVIGYFYITYFTSLPETVVPDLKGMPLKVALSRLEALQLKGKEAGSTFDAKYPEGMVVSQRPEGGRKVKIGRLVSLITSSGKRKVMVPNLLGRPEDQVEVVLAAKGLLLGNVSRDFVPELDPGIILSQSPLPGEEVDSGSYVSVSVSSSQEPEPVIEAVPEAGTKEGGGFKLW